MLTEDGRPQCDTCGAVRPQRLTGLEPHQVTEPCTPWPSRPWTQAEYEESARVAGWRVGVVQRRHDARCAKCSQPDPETVAHCRAIERQIRFGSEVEVQP